MYCYKFHLPVTGKNRNFIGPRSVETHKTKENFLLKLQRDGFNEVCSVWHGIAVEKNHVELSIEYFLSNSPSHLMQMAIYRSLLTAFFFPSVVECIRVFLYQQTQIAVSFGYQPGLISGSDIFPGVTCLFCCFLSK